MPVRPSDGRRRAEAIILEATRRHALDTATSGDEVARSLERRFDPRPRGFYRLRSDLIKMMVRLVLPATELTGAPGVGQPGRRGPMGSKRGDVPA